MTKKELLIKRFNSLVGKIKTPKFLESELAMEAYLSVFELPDEVTVEFIQSALGSHHIYLNSEELSEYKKLGEVEKCLYLLDNVQEARDYCKRHFRK